MRQHSPWVVAVGLSLGLFCQGLVAQENTKPPGTEALTASGKVEHASEEGVQVKVSDTDTWFVQVRPGETKIEVTGAAEPAYIRFGLHVRLAGEIDAKGNLQSEIKEIEIFTPQNKNSLGLFDSTKKLVKKPGPGSYEIRAKVVTLKEHDLVLLAGGKKIFGTLSGEAEVKVLSEDLGLAQPGDEVKFTGWYYPAGKAAAQKPGQAMADGISVTLSKPLVAAKKPVRAVKTARSKSKKMDESGEGEGTAGPLIQDPFGVDKK